MKKAVRPSGDRFSSAPYLCKHKSIMAFQVVLFKPGALAFGSAASAVQSGREAENTLILV